MLTKSGKVITCSTVQHVIESEQKNPSTKILIDEFNSDIHDRLDDTIFIDETMKYTSPYIQDIQLNDDKEMHKGIIPADEDYSDMIFEDTPEADNQEDYDKLTRAELSMEIGGTH